MEENKTYKGKREIRFEEDVSPFSVLAAKNILNEKQEDFDLAVIEYADDDCIDITIDGEERTIYYAETDDGIAFEMIDSDEYDDIMTDYSEYDEDDDEDDEDEDDLPDRYDDDDMEGGVLDSVYFAIAFPVILDQVGIDPEKDKLEGLLHKYCSFLPIPLAFGKKTEWKDGKQVETEEDNIINDVEPLWAKKPADLKDEDYKEFYRKLYPMSDEPLFWIHLNVDYPFNLTGILYFPKIKSNLDLQRNKIQLYCNQVFVTDNVEGIVPEFLMLLHGVIDSPDIPLNVSRSYLQSDQNVKKISGYITKKVSDRLQSIFKQDRPDFEKKWDDIKLFIHYGMLSEEDFYDKAKAYALLKDVDNKYYTLDEYQTLIKDNQTNKDGQLVYLYAQDTESQYTYIQAAKDKGYNVLLMNGQLDTPLISMLERKLEKTTFTRVDADVIDRLIQKEETKRELLEAERADRLTAIFNSQMPRTDKLDFHVEAQALGEDALPVMLTQSEYMRRMKEMSRLQPGMSFYGEMPDMMTLVLNTDAPLIKSVLEDSESETLEKIRPIEAEIKGLTARQAVLRQEQDKKKAEEVTQEEKDDLKKCADDIQAQRDQKNTILSDYGKQSDRVHQLIDLALLQNGMLRGEALTQFVRRSVEMIK